MGEKKLTQFTNLNAYIEKVMHMKNIIFDIPIPFPHINVKFSVFIVITCYYKQVPISLPIHYSDFSFDHYSLTIVTIIVVSKN